MTLVSPGSLISLGSLVSLGSLFHKLHTFVTENQIFVRLSLSPDSPEWWLLSDLVALYAFSLVVWNSGAVSRCLLSDGVICAFSLVSCLCLANACCVCHQYCHITQSKWSPVLAGCSQSKINFSFIYFVLSQIHTQSSKQFINTCAMLHIYPCAYAIYLSSLILKYAAEYSDLLCTYKWMQTHTSGQYLEILSILYQSYWNVFIIINVDKK